MKCQETYKYKYIKENIKYNINKGNARKFASLPLLPGNFAISAGVAL
jgi:hypothetical protein